MCTKGDYMLRNEPSCPVCLGRGEQVTAYVCFGPNPRHETMECMSCEGTGKLEVYILNQLEKESNCSKCRMNWGTVLFDIGMEWKKQKSMRELSRLKAMLNNG